VNKVQFLAQPARLGFHWAWDEIGKTKRLKKDAVFKLVFKE
jgi:hypothetical protein